MPNIPVQAAAEGLPKIQIDSLKTRRAIEAHIERMIALLDSVDGDPDLEPELGWTRHGCGCGSVEPNDEREGDDEREWDPAEMGIADLDGAMELFPRLYGAVQ
ncbi:hypothetical protein [Sinorhizobium fredii]|uniref:hypothetical protein n=1 Tax=Rhizobium fredii TaxID=380 RepID=UPI00210AA496|nr:hypothetical protein [Sinorhizobium fredii]UTY50449.1 hypothetical protein EPK84_28695 [Sinorhizobium fredii]